MNHFADEREKNDNRPGEKANPRAFVLSVHGLHAVHAVHGKSGKNHGESNPGEADPKDLQTNPAHVAGPTVYSCGIRGIKKNPKPFDLGFWWSQQDSNL